MSTAIFDEPGLQERCEEGQAALMEMRYLEAETILVEAEAYAWATRAWDTLGRLYMPLQEARRQRRQRCGEGTVRLDLIAKGPDEVLDPAELAALYSHGQFLVAGWGTIGPVMRLRELQAERGHYAETLLAAVFPVLDSAPPAEADRVIVLVPLAETPLPDPTPRTRAELYAMLPPEALALPAADLPIGARTGTTRTYAEVMGLWERLHTPFLKAADAQPDPVRRMEAYRTTIRVDYACELAHQRLSDTARMMARGG